MVNLDSGSTGGTVHIFSLSMRTDHIGISFGLPLIGLGNQQRKFAWSIWRLDFHHKRLQEISFKMKLP
jgi:hypothetical protein